MNKKGNVGICLKDYLSHIPWNIKRSTAAACKPICDFTGADQTSVRRWYALGIKPVGVTLVKLRYFLDAQGYQVFELESLDNRLRNLGKLIAWNIIDFDQTRKDLGFPDTKGLTRPLHGEGHISDDKIAKIEAICERYSEELNRLGKSRQVLEEKVRVETQPNEVSKTKTDTVRDSIALLKSLDGLVTLLGPRLDTVLSEEFSAEDRREFREKATPELIFYLSNRFAKLNEKLNSICSEKARALRIGKG